MATYRSISAMSNSRTMRVNPMSTLARQLKCWPVIEGGVVFDVITGLKGDVVAGSITREYTKEGVSFTSIANTSLVIPVTHNIGTGPFTMACRYRSNAVPAAWNTSINLPNNSNFGMYIPKNASDLYVAHDAAPGGVTNWANTSVTIGKFETFSMNAAGPLINPILYKNGIFQTATFNGGASDYVGGTTDFEFFNGQNNEDGQGTIAWAALFSRLLGAVEQYELFRDPMQMFTDTRRVMWIPSVSVAVSPYQYGAYWM